MFASKDTLLTRPSGGYTIARSVRLRSSATAYLSRTPSSTTNRRTWTWSGWMKRGTDKYSLLFAAGNVTDIWNTGTNCTVIGYWINTNQLVVYDNGTVFRQTSQVFRDFSAWYHIVVAFDTTQATAANRLRVYINGSEVTSFDTNNAPTQNVDMAVNVNQNHFVGGQSTNVANAYFDGYLTEINFVDGQQLTPSSFGTTNAITGVWQPAKYTGTYGTNGFYLNFSDNSNNTAATIGKDYSGNGNNWTPNNISVTTGVTYDSMQDVPTLTSLTAANYPTINAVNYNSTYLTLSEANLRQTYAGVSAAAASQATMTIPTTGKWYWEVYINATGGGSGERVRVGICSPTDSISGNTIDNSVNHYMQMSNGQKRTGTTDSTYGASFSATQIIQVLYDATAGSIYFGQNNSFANGTGSFNQTFSTATAAFTGLTGEFIPAFVTYGGADISANWGQRPFSYPPPTGFVALNTYNLPAGTITTSGSFTGNVSTDGPFVYLNGVPTAMTINGNAVTFGTNADKLANGFKVRSSSSSYNASGSNTYSITTTGAKFKNANAQTNP